MTILPCFVMLWLLPVAAVSQWYVYYQRGEQELENGEWSKAVHSFQEALKLKPKAELNANTYALNFVEYLPHYNLGRALFFLGDYPAAVENFARELADGAIAKSTHYKTLLRLREIAAAMLAPAKNKSAPATAAWMGLLRAGYQHGQGVMKKSGEIDSLLSQIEMAAESREQIARWFAQLPAGETRPLRTLTPATTAASDSLRQLKNSAITAYLQGRYREALNLFNRLAQLAPDEPELANWQQRLHFELARLDQPAEPAAKTDTVKYVQSAKPVIILRAPEAEVSRVRRGQARFNGLANDDVGIAAIEFVVNGEPWQFANGTRQLHPTPNADGAFPFQVELPLRLEENQISVIAYDLDSTQHSSVLHRRIFRQPPLYHTTAFWVVLGSVLLVAAGAIVGNRLIKYRITFINRYNPYIAGAPIRHEEMFFGRQQLLERIMRTLPNNSLMVYGPRRIGKTSVQYQLQRLLQAREDPDYHFLPVFIDLQGVAEEVFFAHLIEEVREQLGEEIAGTVPAPVGRQQYSHREFANNLRNVINILQSRLGANKKVRLVFLIDEVDELNRYSERTNQRLRAIFMKSFSENLVAVLTGSNIRKEWESESSPWYNFFEQVPMPALSQNEALQLIHAPVKGFFKFAPEAAGKIWEVSQGRPFVIQKFCVRLINLAIEKKRRQITGADVEAIRHEVLQDTTPTAEGSKSNVWSVVDGKNRT
jgi:tetratricopeptide (TPR) repeat protein